MRKKKDLPCEKAQQRIVEHLHSGKALTICVSACPNFGRLYAHSLSCKLIDLIDLIEKGVLITRDFQFLGLDYKEFRLVEGLHHA